MTERSELELAELKYEMRQLYKSIGFEAAIVVLSDMLLGAKLLGEVIVEERRKE